MQSTIFRLWETVQNNNAVSLTNKLQGGGKKRKQRKKLTYEKKPKQHHPVVLGGPYFDP